MLNLPLSLEDAKRRNLCRLCGEPAGGFEVFGVEFVHGVCWKKLARPQAETVDHPEHYGGKDNPHEVIKVLCAWGLEKDSLLWNMGKYLGRWDKKDTVREQIGKSIWYGLRRLAILDGFDPNTYNDAIAEAKKKQGAA